MDGNYLISFQNASQIHVVNFKYKRLVVEFIH